MSYEAVYGAEYYKWRQEPSTANIITYLFTRNVVGSADFTPTALPVAGISATYGFMLGTTIYVESGLVHFAENVNVYEGYKGLSLMNDIPVTWDETVLVEGLPGAYGTVARRSDKDWYVVALTVAKRDANIDLSFLEDGKTYKAYIYKTNETKDNIEIEIKDVKASDVLKISLAANDGVSIKITENEFDYVTDYEKNYTYFEGEKATLSGAAKISNIPFNDQYASGKKSAEYIGNGIDNSVTFTVNVDKEGENTIMFYNDEAFAPNIDRIALSKEPVNATISISDEEKDVVENSPGAEYEYTMYEAEKAVIASGATNEGHMVGWLGGTAYVEFNAIEVANAGTNIIKVSNPNGYAPNLDKIGVSVTCK